MVNASMLSLTWQGFPHVPKLPSPSPSQQWQALVTVTDMPHQHVCASELVTLHWVQLSPISVNRPHACQTSGLFQPSGAKGAQLSLCI